MLACLDAHYDGDQARTACLLFQEWADQQEQATYLDVRQGVSDYQSGNFFRRELPGLLSVLSQLPEPPSLVIVDGFVWLNREGNRPGLGAHLHQETGLPVIGVAKTRYNPSGGTEGGETASPSGGTEGGETASPLGGTGGGETLGAIAPVCRGSSRTPLFVSAAGTSLEAAVAGLRAMHGANRIPTLLRRVDQLARGLIKQLCQGNSTSGDVEKVRWAKQI